MLPSAFSIVEDGLYCRKVLLILKGGHFRLLPV